MGTRFRGFPQTPRGRGSPYLDFILSLSTLSMFELNEAVRGRLIGPKTWDQNVGNFFRNFFQFMTVGAFMGC